MTIVPLAITALLAGTLTPLELVTSVHQTYLKAGDITAKFSQVYVGGLRGKKQEAEGRLWAKQDGRVRWDYEQPEPKIFIYNGTSAYLYEPLNAQVMIFDDLKDTKMAQALRLLMGQEDVRKHFAVGACELHCGLAQKNEVVVELVPNKPLVNIERVALVIDPVSKRVVMTTTFDSLGYRTEYRFTDLEFNAQVSDDRFLFEKPAGVHELRATDMINAQPK